ncbi:Ribosomal silencing factor during starvation [Teratosphaeria destructans]|uniref:ATPase synthesis protein 25 n=1 Tax=Teratosphaeria destructans TaxID=418781 RepID=A0A9W7SUG7_9PEZI|nr:Ribosomal silencing factor during starvation [Teratosphaeria destructans]
MTLALRSTGCSSCRQWMLRSFIASIGGHPLVQPSPQRRTFSQVLNRRNEARKRVQRADDHPLNAINDVDRAGILGKQSDEQSMPAEDAEDIERETLIRADGLDPEVDTNNSDTIRFDTMDAIPEADQAGGSAVPWYLQAEHQPVQPHESPMAARQRLPDLPDHPPPLLQPLLEHVSIELGIDDLSLLDLRILDPPPALGANLFMIVGTARSEKHLHVSADKLCRWLRSDPYHLSPFADGLLGRNELKLKMRRRAKRTRMMAGVGAKTTADTDLEEGIRTGWVCINVGRVDGGELPEVMAARQQKQQNVVGFGTVSSGSNLVVQLMTEEKRGQMDLEKLWTGILNRNRKEREEREERDQEAAGDEARADAPVQQALDPAGVETSERSVQRVAGMST